MNLKRSASYRLPTTSQNIPRSVIENVTLERQNSCKGIVERKDDLTSTALVKAATKKLEPPILMRYSMLCTSNPMDEFSTMISTNNMSPSFKRNSAIYSNVTTLTRKGEITMKDNTPQFNHSIVVAIDFGTVYSGYAYSFTHEPETIHFMRQSEGDDPGVNNQKIPSILLLSPEKQFHSFGIIARDSYHDLKSSESKKWFFFDKFKMILHHKSDICRSTYIQASNGCSLLALHVFSLALNYFRERALQELTDVTGEKIDISMIRWVITVPAIWRQQAKQFMREAAYEAGISSSSNPESLLIALEPEAASVYCRKIKMNQLLKQSSKDLSSDFVLEDSSFGGRYMIVDCGGGTVDITVHELSSRNGKLKELFKATGGPYGSNYVDEEFEALLDKIFGCDFMVNFKKLFPSGYIDLMVAFEAKKRRIVPHSDTCLKIPLPYSLINYFKQTQHRTLNDLNGLRPYISFTETGMLCLEYPVIHDLFTNLLSKVLKHVNEILDSVNLAAKLFGVNSNQNIPNNEGEISVLFLVGGFSQSLFLQKAFKSALEKKIQIIIPKDAGIAVLRGAVLYGMNPSIVFQRRAMKTYGIGVIKPFKKGFHPKNKLVIKNGLEWCLDVFDTFVSIGDSVNLGETIVRNYIPTSSNQKTIIIDIFSTENHENPAFITESSVQKCGSLVINLKNASSRVDRIERNIKVKMLFGETEIKASATDVVFNTKVEVSLDFLNEKNPKYVTRM